MIEVVVVLVVVAIIVTLGFGLIGMVKGGKIGSNKMFNSLVTRVTLSVLLFLLVLFAGYMGWIEPNVVMMDAPAQK